MKNNLESKINEISRISIIEENYRIKYNYKEGLNIQLYSKDVSAWMRDRDY